MPFLPLIVPLVLAGLPQDPAVSLAFVPSGATAKKGGYMPQRLELSADKPASVHKLPEGLGAPLFGVLTTGIGEGERRFALVVDEPEGGPARLWVDGNANGDLTDDPAAEWEGRAQPGRDGESYLTHSGGADVELFADGTRARIAMYRFDPRDPSRAQLKTTLLYYGDYAREGEMVLGGKTFRVMLSDDLTVGDFRGRAADEAPAQAGGPERRASGVRLLVDVNGNGTFDSRGEAFDVRQPFNIGGTTRELAALDPTGARFELVKSSREVAEILPPPDHGIGKTITPFTATDTAGNALRFPEDFKGKVVLLDFWATWCGPCMVEVPNLVRVHEKLGPRGMEVLGISLDRADQLEKLQKVTGEHKMTWRQVYDGKFWEAEVALLYGIQSIPAVFLVDGDTGEILADGRTLRGEKLEETVVQALERKAAGGKGGDKGKSKGKTKDPGKS